MTNELAACSIRPTSPSSVKNLPVQIPSSSGETTSSETALSSRTLRDICCQKQNHQIQSNTAAHYTGGFDYCLLFLRLQSTNSTMHISDMLQANVSTQCKRVR